MHCLREMGKDRTAFLALQTAIDVVSTMDDPVALGVCARQLGFALGSSRLQSRSETSIIAVLDQLVNPTKFQRDQDAWESHGATRSNFKKWKRRIVPIFEEGGDLEAVVDEVSEDMLEAVARETALFSERDREDEIRILFAFNSTADEFPCLCMHEVFGQNAHQYPSNASLELDGSTASYNTLLCRAHSITRSLARLHVSAQQNVGLLGPCCVEFISGLLGILLHGCAFLPIDVLLPAQRIEWMMDDLEVGVLALTRVANQVITSRTVTRVYLEDDFSESSSRGIARVPLSSLMYVLFTSGSTGRPKGVMLEHRGAGNRGRGASWVQARPREIQACARWDWHEIYEETREEYT